MKWGAFIGGATLAALASLPVSSPARAADMTPIGQRAIPATSGYIPAQFFWTGFYLGASAGYGFGTSTFIDPLPAALAASASPSLKGFLAGGVSGINYQISSVVLGVEGDFTGSWAKGSAIDTVGDSLQTQVFWTASITGRVGVAFDRLLIYGKAGVGFDYDRDIVAAAAGGVATGTTYHIGWTAGGGVEYAITEHWIGRIAYDYFTFPMRGVIFTGTAIPSPGILVNSGAGGSVGVKLNEIKAIMAYKF
jgi:outer membrane immunogenic protein